MRNFDPSDWYWLAEDGRVFSSARFTTVGKDDAGFATWSEDGAAHRPDEQPWPPSMWPRDDSGAQTLASLQAVLTPYGLTVDGKPLPKTLFAPRDFIALFAPAEQTALLSSDVAQIKVFVAIALAGNVDLTNADVIADINALVPAGLITSDRAKQILAGQAPA